MGLGEGLDCFFEPGFFGIKRLLLIPKALKAQFTLPLLLHQQILAAASAQQSGIGSFQVALQLLPGLHIPFGLGISLLTRELLELCFQRCQGGLQRFQSLAPACFCGAQRFEALIALFAAFHQWAMGPAGGRAFRFKGGLALLELPQAWPRGFKLFQQALLFPATGHQGFA